jgi:curli production assembly/transport component CsgF
MVMSKTVFRMACVAGMIGFLTPAFATEQVYHPISPALGGNPSNGTFLLSTAQAQGEGVNSGNQGPNLTPLLNGLGSAAGGAAGGAATGSTVANPTGSAAKMP